MLAIPKEGVGSIEKLLSAGLPSCAMSCKPRVSNEVTRGTNSRSYRIEMLPDVGTGSLFTGVPTFRDFVKSRFGLFDLIIELLHDLG